jgi:hypothetical protein
MSPTAEEIQAQGSTSQGEQPQFVTKDEIATLIHSAVVTHLKKSLPKEVTAAVKSAVEETLPTLRDQLGPKPPADGEDTAKKPHDPSPEVAAMRKQMNELQAQIKEERERTHAAERKRLEEKAHGDLRAALQNKVRPEALDMAVKAMIYEGRLVVQDDGTPLFKVRSALGRGMSEEDHEFPLAEGVEEFLKTKEAAFLIPAPSGPGARKPQDPSLGGRHPNGRQIPQYAHEANSVEEAMQRVDQRVAVLGGSFE